MTETVIRPSSLPAWNDCARRVAANELLRGELEAKGIKLYHHKADVGAAIGHALHAGAADLLKAKRDGNTGTIPHATAVAVVAFRQEIKDGCNYDKKPGVTSAQEAEKHIGRMIFVYQQQVLPLIDPDYIEEELRADVGDGFVLVGHPDTIEVSPTLRDLKSGADTWPAGAQLGGYILLAKANEFEIGKAVIDYIPRVSIDKPQPPAEQIEYDVTQCRREAARTIRRIKAAVSEYRETGDIEAIPANPMSALCSNRWCTARGTEFCKSWKH
jgi:hypothetical protein